MKKVTIAVITCRRPQWLKRLLLALTKQLVNQDVELDVLVVDNAQDSGTKNVVTEVMSLSPFTIRYDAESEAGIVFARNKCVDLFLKSDSDYLVFIDDDEWPAKSNWAQELLNSVSKLNADIVTSHVVSVGEEGTPKWAVELIYGRNPYTDGQKIDIFYTNNVLISRKVLETVYPAFDKRFAMTGASDYHFALRCRNQGFSCFYIDSPVEEEFPKSRATLKWFLRRGFRSGIGYTRAHLFEDGIWRAISLGLFMAGVRFARGVSFLIWGALSRNKRMLVDGLFRLCSCVGTIMGFFGVKHEEYKVIHGK